MSRTFRVGAVFPQNDMPADAAVIGHYARTVEALGYDYLLAYDHVIGADPANRPDWTGHYTIDTSFLEPLTLFAHLSAVTSRLELVTGVVILPQRQTVLFAKQAATLDILCGGRLRLGVGLGWNKVEYQSLGVPFEKRGTRMNEQLELLRRLWTERAVTQDSAHHTVIEAGLKPLPVQRPIPLWIGGVTDHALRRAARLGDGWLPTMPVERAAERLPLFRQGVEEAGRDPDTVPVENIVFLGRRIGGVVRGPEDARRDAETWRAHGASGVAIDTMEMGLATIDDHLAILEQVAVRMALDTR